MYSSRFEPHRKLPQTTLSVSSRGSQNLNPKNGSSTSAIQRICHSTATCVAFLEPSRLHCIDCDISRALFIDMISYWLRLLRCNLLLIRSSQFALWVSRPVATRHCRQHAAVSRRSPPSPSFLPHNSPLSPGNCTHTLSALAHAMSSASVLNALTLSRAAYALRDCIENSTS